jgi:uncharacterized membrane protein YbhN (UPF0104 family)
MKKNFVNGIVVGFLFATAFWIAFLGYAKILLRHYGYDV